jgi:hypothetical protein
VKKYASILFLSIYLFSVFQISEFIKLPLLVEHFVEHQREDPKLQLWDFLCMHYAHGEVKDADYDKDMRLPFKSHHSGCSCSVITFLAPIQTFNFEYKTFLKERKKPSFGYTFSFISNFHSSIWQPPKIC